MRNKYIEAFENAQIASKSVPEFRAGDTLKVALRIREGDKSRVQNFEGVCIARRGSGVGETFIIRKIGANNVGVERIFPIFSESIEGIEVLRKGRVRRSKLFYLRERRGKAAKIKELRKHISLVFQFPEYQLFEETVEKDVAFGLKNFGYKEKEAIELAHKALLSVGLDEKYFQKSPFELSGGERRRVAIAGILAIDPDILVLDEPTAGLDVKGAKDVMTLIKTMHENGKTIIMVTHDMDLVMKYCNLVYVLKDGKLAYEGNVSKLFDEVGEDSAIEIPPLYKLAQKLKEKGAPIEIEKIKSVDDLVNQVKGWNRRHG